MNPPPPWGGAPRGVTHGGSHSLPGGRLGGHTGGGGGGQRAMGRACSCRPRVFWRNQSQAHFFAVGGPLLRAPCSKLEGFLVAGFAGVLGVRLVVGALASFSALQASSVLCATFAGQPAGTPSQFLR